MLTETYGGKTYSYDYDEAGNIRSVSDGTTTHSYSYGDAQWKDLLTAYDGQSITYDAIGNPTAWYDGTAFTWALGRRLTSAVNSGTGLDNSYTYDSNGLRLTKTIGDIEHKYVWQGGKLVSENWAGQELEFFYDESGSPYAFSYKASATAAPVMYYYVTNLQGDVVNILNASGSTVASYSYNAWGKVLTATGTMAAVNPLRYRGYYFDTDTGLYYLQSRYYDPEICRFINADSNVSTGQGFVGTNMFAYCLNNPVAMKDIQGNLAAWLVGGLVGGLIGGAVSALEGNGFAAGFVQGAVSGAIAGAGVDLAVACVATGGLVGVAVGAGVSYLTGYYGDLAGQQARSVVTGNGLKKIDSTMRRTARGTGIINTMSFGLGALFQYADDGFRALKESVRKYGVFKTAFSKSFDPGISDAYSAFAATHTANWGTANSYIWGNPNSRYYYNSNYPYKNPCYSPMRDRIGYR